MQQVTFNDSWRRLPDIHKGANKINWQKGAILVKTEEQKIHALTNAQIDALLTKIMDTEASRAYITMPEPRMAYITNRSVI